MPVNLTDLTLMTQRRAEQLFAGASFISPEYALQTCGWVKPEILIEDRIRRYWINLNDGYKKDASGAAMEAGCYRDMAGWMNEVTSYLDIESYAREIQRRAYLASCDKFISDVLLARQDGNVPRLHAAISALHNHAPEQADTIPDAADVALEFLSYMDAPDTSIKMQIPCVDDAIGGLERKLLSVVAARPSMGKSTFLFQCARQVARTTPNKVIYFSNDMSRLQLWAKAACGALEIRWRDVRRGLVTPEQRQQVKDMAMEIGEACGYNLLIDDRMHHTTSSIWQVVSNKRPAWVIIDVAKGLKDPGRNTIERLETIVKESKTIARDLDCHVTLVHHVNRATEETDNKRPSMKNLADCSEFEKTADIVMFLHSAQYYENQSMPEIMETDLIIDKNRDDKRNNVVHLKFLTRQQWFVSAKDI